jgi:hypothetical protein
MTKTYQKSKTFSRSTLFSFTEYKTMRVLFSLLSFVFISSISYAQVTVTTNTFWNPLNQPPSGYEQGVTIINGAILTIEGLNLILIQAAEININKSTLILRDGSFEMGQDARIVLDGSCGNLLEVDGMILTSSLGATWKGIHMDKAACGAHGLQEQYETYPSIGNDGNCTPEDWEGVLYSNPNPNKLNGVASRIIANNSTIENAEVAINVDGDANYFTGGGLTRVRVCTFLNCEKGVRIAGWGKKSPNASYIMTSDFIWDDNLLFGKSNLVHVEFQHMGISAVNVGGCKFHNDINSQDPVSDRGIGINSIVSDFTISKDGDKCCAEGTECPDNCFSSSTATSRRNEFKQLGKGINFEGGSSGWDGNVMSCRYSDFTNCMNGIDADACLDGVVGRNTFTIVKNDIDTYYPSGTSTSSGIIDVKFNASSGLRIYNNVFNADLEYIVGVRFESPDQTQTSFIRRNTFTSTYALTQLCGPQVRAIDLYGNNNHVDITCNTFIEQVYDIHLDDGATLDDLPDLKVHGVKKYNRNKWSSLPAQNNPSVPDFRWKTLGCASNIFSEANSVTVYDRYNQLGFDNMRFQEVSYPQFNAASSASFNIGQCPSGWTDDLNSPCVDCNTDCEQLKITKVETSGFDKLKVYQNGYIRVYPNPSKGQFTVTLINNQFGNDPDLKIYNSFGQVVYLQTMESRSITMDTESLNFSSGIYFIHVDGNQATSTLKLIVQ